MEDIDLKWLVLVLTSLMPVFPVQASGHYLLPKIGVMSLDLNNARTIPSIGLLYGYNLTNTSSIETELSQGLHGGKYTTMTQSGNVRQGEYRPTTLAGYGVYRLALLKTVYLKAKAGIIYEYIERRGNVTVPGSGSLADNDTASGFGMAGGIGVGKLFKGGILENTVIELELTSIDSDISFYSIGFSHSIQ